MIDKNSPIPMYYQLEELIKEKIETNELQPGSPLPSERELSNQFKISRMTVRQAIINLVNKGYLYREVGKGTFVSEKKFEQDLQGLTSFTEDMKIRGLSPSTKLLKFSVINVDHELSETLGIDSNETVYEIKRVRLANNKPIALEMSYVPAKLIPQLTEKILKSSFYEYIENTLGLKISYATQTLEATIATGVETEHLQIKKGDPVLLITRETFLEDGRLLETVKSLYRADKYKFSIDINRKK